MPPKEEKMSNLSFLLKNSSFSVSSFQTLDELMNSLVYGEWRTIIYSFVFPSISLLGTIFGSINFYIFFQENFKDSVFFYYRLLCLVYIIHLIHNIPYGICFSPRYLPHINIFLSSWYELYYMAMTTFLFHFEDVIQMAILLTEWKSLIHL